MFRRERLAGKMDDYAAGLEAELRVWTSGLDLDLLMTSSLFTDCVTWRPQRDLLRDSQPRPALNYRLLLLGEFVRYPMPTSPPPEVTPNTEPHPHPRR